MLYVSSVYKASLHYVRTFNEYVLLLPLTSNSISIGHHYSLVSLSLARDRAFYVHRYYRYFSSALCFHNYLLLSLFFCGCSKWKKNGFMKYVCCFERISHSFISLIRSYIHFFSCCFSSLSHNFVHSNFVYRNANSIKSRAKRQITIFFFFFLNS